MRTLLVSLAVLVVACNSGPSASDAGSTTFTHHVDPSLAGSPSQGRPLSAVRSSTGVVHRFIANQLLLASADRAQLDQVLARVGGRVVATDAVPEPPAEAQVQLDAADLVPTQYTVEVDLSKASVGALDVDASKAGLSGDTAFSSDDAVKLLALVTHEKAAGLAASPNFVFEGSYLSATAEHPSGMSFDDAFRQLPFQATGSRSNVVKMWQLVDAAPPSRRSRVAIIDSGFWLDGAGHPMSSVTPAVTDLPSSPLQYDFNGDDRLAGGPGLNSCSGGSPCPWHGNGAAGVAVGALDNRYGGAGTGGQVANPLLFNASLDWGQVSRAIRTAVAWRADVISMSFGASCDNAFCDLFFETNLYPALRNAREHGVVSVAAAGNDSQGASGKVPCKAEDVICVGALDDGTTNAIWYSNFDGRVTIWAPTNIPTNPDPETAPNTKSFGGTSASTPFVAGVVAVMKAYSPTLTGAQVADVLRRTAYTGSTDPKVTHVLDAFRAVHEVSTANAPPEVRIESASGFEAKLNLNFTLAAATVDLEDGSPCCEVTWSPAPIGVGEHGRSATYLANAVGSFPITATITDRQGRTASSTATIRVVNAAPTLEVLAPLSTAMIIAGQPTQLQATALDENEPLGRLDCARVRWASSNPADPLPVSGCDTVATFPTAGNRVLTVTATDPQGQVTTVLRSISVAPPPVNYPPTITMGALPAINYASGFTSNSTISVTASATDPEGNTPLTYRWFATIFSSVNPLSVSSPRAALGAGTSSTSGNLNWVPDTATGRWQTFATVGNACYQGQHVQLELEVTDSLGNKSTRALPIFTVYVCVLM